MFAGACLFSLGILLCSQATSLWHLFLLFGMLGSVGLVSTLMPLVVTVTHWFDKRQGLALGIAQAFNTGTFVVSPLAALMVTNYGWQRALLVLGGLALVIVVPLTVFIREPQRLDAATTQEQSVSDLSQDIRLRQALGTRTFWSLKFMVLGCCVCHSFLLLHLVNYLTDQGIVMRRAAMLFGIMGLASAAGRIANGLAADRFGAKPAIAGFLLVQGLGVMLFLRPDQNWLLYLGIIVWGVAMAGPMSCYPMLYRQYFGKRHLGMLMSGFYTVGGLGMALGGLLAGVLFDVTGGYQLSFSISLIGGVGAALIAMTLQPPDRSLVGEHKGIGRKPVPA